MSRNTIAKAACSPVQTTIATTLRFDLPGELQQARLAVPLTREALAQYIGCTGQAIHNIEAGSGSFEVLMRAMDALKFDLTGMKPGLLLHDRLRATREARNWTIEKLAFRSNLSPAAVAALENGTGKASDLLIVLEVLAPRYGRRASPHAKTSSDKDSRFTPWHILDSIEKAFGPITLDPCADARSSVIALQTIERALGGDGLTQDWIGDLVFVNPPYSGSSQWLRRVLAQWEKGGITKLLCLANAKTDSVEFHRALGNGASVFFFQGRVKYRKPDGTQEPSPQASMMLAFGTDAAERMIFAERERGTWNPG